MVCGRGDCRFFALAWMDWVTVERTRTRPNDREDVVSGNLDIASKPHGLFTLH
jgi:hypothetical protein